MNGLSFIYDHRRGTILGVPVTWIFVLLAVFLVLVWKRLKKPIEAITGVSQTASGVVNGVLEIFTPGESEQEKAQNRENVKSANDQIAKSLAYGQPNGDDKAKAESLYKLMDGYFNQSKVAEIIGTITGKYEMNRVFTAFGIRTIVHGGIPFFRKKVQGDLIAHLGAYDIDLNKKYQRKDGSYFTISAMLKHIGG